MPLFAFIAILAGHLLLPFFADFLVLLSRGAGTSRRFSFRTTARVFRARSILVFTFASFPLSRFGSRRTTSVSSLLHISTTFFRTMSIGAAVVFLGTFSLFNPIEAICGVLFRQV